MKRTKKYTDALKAFENIEHVECKGCHKGESMCRRPCWGTPEEIKKIIDAGYGHKLMLDYWSNFEGNIQIICPANPGYESSDAPDIPMFSFLTFGGDLESGCTFQRLLTL